MIDAQTQVAGFDRPMGRHRARCKGEQFERMTLRIAKFECGHPAGGRRQSLRAIRRDRRPVTQSLQIRIGRCHIGHYNREMLKQRIPSSNFARITASRRLRVSERNRLVAQAQGSLFALSLCKSDKLSKGRIDLWRILNGHEIEGAYIEFSQPFRFAADQVDPR